MKLFSLVNPHGKHEVFSTSFGDPELFKLTNALIITSHREPEVKKCVQSGFYGVTT